MNRRLFIATLAAAAAFGSPTLAQSNTTSDLDALNRIHGNSMQRGYESWKEALDTNRAESAAIAVLSDIISYANNIAAFAPAATNVNTLIVAAGGLRAASTMVAHIKGKMGGKSAIVDGLIVAAEAAIIKAEKAVQARLEYYGVFKKKQEELEKEMEPSPIIEQLEKDGLL